MTYLALILSVLVGACLVFLVKLSNNIVKLFLSFSGAYLLAVTVLHLLPEVYSSGSKNIGLFILLGILIQSLLEFFSKGVEHGHVHAELAEKSFPWLLFISLSIHAFSEGIPLGKTEDTMLLWAIVIHKIPISIVLATFLLHSKLPKLKVFLFILLFALMSPLGCFVCESIPLFETYQAPITAVIVGIFLHVSSIILFESSENHTFNYKKFIAIGVGILIALLAN
ncbi:MAG: ZIP family metal transporter [Flavobacteriaceae bacterium]|nr:ZIP family metal transporter [Flavobacteriaceae bacterium]